MVPKGEGASQVEGLRQKGVPKVVRRSPGREVCHGEWPLRGRGGRQGERGLKKRGSPWERLTKGKGPYGEEARGPWAPRARVPTPAPRGPGDTPQGMKAAQSLALCSSEVQTRTWCMLLLGHPQGETAGGCTLPQPR